MSFEAFGPFSIALEKTFQTVPAYLALLNLDAEETVEVLRDLRDASARSEDPAHYLIALLGETNWRHHLVAAAAIAIGPRPSVCGAALWNAIDHGSWVTPQLAVAAYLADANFAARARLRVDAGCPVQPSEDMSPLERHVQTGPADAAERSAKTMATLIALCRHVLALKAWVKEAEARADVQATLAKDVDGSGEIAARWLAAIEATAPSAS